MHGGTILKYLDQVAYACASRYAGHYVVTLSVDQVVFREPIHVGELVTFLAAVNFTGRTSMEIGIKVVTEDIRKKLVRHTNKLLLHDGGGGRARRARAEVPPLNPGTWRKSSASWPRGCGASCARKWNAATARSARNHARRRQRRLKTRAAAFNPFRSRLRQGSRHSRRMRATSRLACVVGRTSDMASVMPRRMPLSTIRAASAAGMHIRRTACSASTA